MLGYCDWRDVRNDLLLFAGFALIGLFGYVLHDWAMFPTEGSRVLGWVWMAFGPESDAFMWVRRVYMWGR